jgi:hypothetical protein
MDVVAFANGFDAFPVEELVANGLMGPFCMGVVASVPNAFVLVVPNAV